MLLAAEDQAGRPTRVREKYCEASPVSSPPPGPGLSASPGLSWHTFIKLVSGSSQPLQAHQPTHQQFVLKLSSSYFSRPLQPASIDPSQTLR